MREYTVQYLNDTHDWTRVFGIYRDIEGATAHGASLLEQGYVVRILGRTLGIRDQKMPWHTIRMEDSRILLDKHVFHCPS